MKPKYPKHDVTWYRTTLLQLSHDVAPRLGPDCEPGAVAQHVEDLLFVAEMELFEAGTQVGGDVDVAITALQQAERAIGEVHKRLDGLASEVATEYSRKVAKRARKDAKRRAKTRRS